jgi:hypothetical protein
MTGNTSSTASYPDGIVASADMPIWRGPRKSRAVISVASFCALEPRRSCSRQQQKRRDGGTNASLTRR